LGVQVKTGDDLQKLLSALASRGAGDGESLERDESMLDLGHRAPFALAPQHGVFHDAASHIRRFDLQLAELRREQDVVPSHELAPFGSHMPAVLQWVKRDEAQAKSWTRIRETLRDIAADVIDVRVNTLKTGREYVEFLETRNGRNVESWESADGTLRALAMLLVVETHSSHGTVIIEEPEHSLHPWAVRSLIGHIRRAVADRHIQVVLTTHSQQVLEEASPEEVLVVTRNSDSGTMIRSVPEIIPHGSVSSGDLGRMWVKGLLGGIPEPRSE
jgi:predicted ATPase